MGWISHLKDQHAEDAAVQEITTELEKDVGAAQPGSRSFFLKSARLRNSTPAILHTSWETLRVHEKCRLLPDASFHLEREEPNHFWSDINTPLWVGGGKHHAQCLRCHGWQGQHHHPFYEEEGFNCIDITDTGKGITPSKFKTVFNPGYSTKQRGWGLGLSLAKRIIEEYHKGKIFVKSSKIDVGTTFVSN